MEGRNKKQSCKTRCSWGLGTQHVKSEKGGKIGKGFFKRLAAQRNGREMAVGKEMNWQREGTVSSGWKIEVHRVVLNRQILVGLIRFGFLRTRCCVCWKGLAHTLWMLPSRSHLSWQHLLLLPLATSASQCTLLEHSLHSSFHIVFLDITIDRQKHSCVTNTMRVAAPQVTQRTRSAGFVQLPTALESCQGNS